MALRHTSDRHTMGLLFRARLNNFYDAVTRLPQASVAFPVQQIGRSRFYYEGHAQAAVLERLWPDGNDAEPYSTARLDTRHSLSLGHKLGFLTLVPEAGFRSTYYSDTPPGEGETDKGRDKVRWLYHAGAQASFKAFKMLRQGSTDGKPPLRHVVEPFAKYVYVPDPNLGPDDLYDFDSIDRLDAVHSVQLGVRNKLQAKRKDRPFDLVDAAVWTDGNLDAGDNEHFCDYVMMDTELRILNGILLDLDGEYRTHEDHLSRFNTRAIIGNRKRTYAGIEHRFRKDTSSLIGGKLVYRPNKRWTCRYDARYELEDSRLEDHTLALQRTFDCMYFSLGLNQIPGYTRSDGTEREEEYRLLFALQMKALPGIGLSSRDME